MCDINCIWLFNLLVAFVLIIHQQQQHVVECSIQQQQTTTQQLQQQQQFSSHHQPPQNLRTPRATSSLSSPYDGITSYATAVAAKYLHQHSLPKVNVVKREIKTDKNTDFISYLSDFNMQDETSIPEDIFDQRHLREVEEKERYVGKQVQGGVATTANVAAGDGDVIDLNLPYDDADADAAADSESGADSDAEADADVEADIILESQRSIERNFSNDDDVGSYNNNNNRGRDRTVRVEAEVGVAIETAAGVKSDKAFVADDVGDMSEVQSRDNSQGLSKLYAQKDSNNVKDLPLKQKKKLNSLRSNDDKKRQQRKEIKYENYLKSSAADQRRSTYGKQTQEQDFTKRKIVDEDTYYDSLIDDDEDDDDGSAEYERFKLMHEQKQRELQLQRERETQQREMEIKRQQQQQQQRQQLDNLQQQQQQYHMSSWKKLNDEKFNKPSLNDNEETIMMMANMDNFADQDDNNAGNNKNNKNNDDDDDDDDHDRYKNDKVQDFMKSQQDKEIIIQQSEQQEQRQQSSQQQSQQQQQDAIGDIDDEQESNENDSILKESQNPVEKNNANPNVLIPRKMKRHNGAARLDDATNRYARIKKQQQQQQQQQQQHQLHWPPHQQSKFQNSNENDDESYESVDNQEEYMPHFGRQHRGESFKKSYYGIVNRNSTQVDDSVQSKDNGKDNGERDVNASDKGDIATIKTSPTLHEGARGETLFEKEKSLRRNNKHYGHKSHKKKYKDYLRYSSLMMIRAPPSSAAAPTPTTTTTPAAALSAVVVTSTSTPNDLMVTPTRAIKQSHPSSEDILRFHKENYGRKLKMDKLKGLPPSPIFVLKAKTLESQEKMDSHHSGIKPFYEGQINYYLETDDDDDSLLGGRGSEARFITKGDRMDTNDWYRKLSPVLRNGVKTGGNTNKDDKDDRLAVTGTSNIGGVAASSSGGGSSSVNGVVSNAGYTPYHHYRTHHQRNQHHHHGSNNNHQKEQQQHHRHHQHSRHHAYQRKMLPKKVMVTTTPLPPPSRRHQEANSPIQELAHQITDVKEFERYYAKWPHLARVQSQLHDEQLREQLELQNLQQQQMGNYQDYEYDEDYFEALQTGNVEENVPPYIRKYNRRNKQLLDLLEGTLPPPTRPPQQLRWSGSKLQPGPRDSSVGSMSVRIDDDYLKEKRKRYHQRQKQIHDLFEQQRTITTTATSPPTMATTTHPYKHNNGKSDISNSNHYENHLPDEDVSISLETQEQDVIETHNWHTVRSGKSPTSTSSIPGKSLNAWQKEKLISTSTPASLGSSAEAVTPQVAPTLKPALYKLPSYPSIAGSFIQRPRSRSAQFAPSSGSEYRRITPLQFNSGANNFINAGGFVAFNGAASSVKNNAAAHNNGKSMSARFSAGSDDDDVENNTGSAPKPEAVNTSKNNRNNQHDSTGSSSISAASQPQASLSSSAAAATSQSQSSTSSSPSSSSSSLSSSSPASVSNSFVYHRVIDASPRFVGAGLTGRKQRLPFVAITDRRLETSKKSLTDHQKDFEQNHYPMP